MYYCADNVFAKKLSCTVRQLLFFFKEKRPRGQAAKTPPFHGGNTGSIPVGVTLGEIRNALLKKNI